MDNLQIKNIIKNKMITYLVIGICIFLLLAVFIISAKPISMGIEARRNIKDNK